MNLRFTFYESLQAQCSKQEYKFVYKILYPIYSQSKKNDQKTDYRIITVSDRFHPYLLYIVLTFTVSHTTWMLSFFSKSLGAAIDLFFSMKKKSAELLGRAVQS